MPRADPGLMGRSALEMLARLVMEEEGLVRAEGPRPVPSREDCRPSWDLTEACWVIGGLGG